MIMKKIGAAILAALLLLPLAAFPSRAEPEGAFRVLFIGNSYSEDATDGFTYGDGAVYTGYSTFYEMMKTALGDSVDVEVGLVMSGGKSLTWHCAKAEKDSEEYSFRLVGDSTGGRWTESETVKTSKGALLFADWDAVVLQPYGLEIEKGRTSTSNATMKKYAELSASVPYMLDFVAENAPGADIYLYLIASKSQELEYGAGGDVFSAIRRYTAEAEGYTGVNTGARFKAVVPAGTAIQNARSTFLSLQYSVDPSGVVSFDTDPVTGLQRDELHVSYSVGRYIEALTFAETFVPESERVGDPLTVPIRRPEGALPLPEEYKDAAAEAVRLALASADTAGEDRFAPVDLGSYKDDPILGLLSRLLSEPLGIVDDAERDREEVIADGLSLLLPESASFVPDFSTLTLTEDGGAVSGTLTYGYTARDAALYFVLTDHIHEWERESFDFAHDGRSECTETLVCAVCGDRRTVIWGKTPCPSAGFADVPPFGDWAHDGIDFCLENSLMKGVGETLFDPEGEMTRAMLVTVLWRAAGEPHSENISPFLDLREEWYGRAVDWAFENDVVKGVEKTKFAPDDPLTREQIATILFRYTQKAGKATDERANLSGFPDVGLVDAYALDAMSWACSTGLIKGVGIGGVSYLDPLGDATRAQVATILSRYMGD
ncbi:MAG: DUF4886 domain-containing protein [Clostridia bacterium]|nr:DUF4886 domain-containing protein [Clostridia bacterium]